MGGTFAHDADSQLPVAFGAITYQSRGAMRETQTRGRQRSAVSKDAESWENDEESRQANRAAGLIC